METEKEQVKESVPEEEVTKTEVESDGAPPPASRQRGLERGSPNSSVKRNGSLRRDLHRKGSLRRDQRTGEKRRSRTGSLGSLVGYEAKFPVSARGAGLSLAGSAVRGVAVVGSMCARHGHGAGWIRDPPTVSGAPCLHIAAAKGADCTPHARP